MRKMITVIAAVMALILALASVAACGGSSGGKSSGDDRPSTGIATTEALETPEKTEAREVTEQETEAPEETDQEAAQEETDQETEAPDSEEQDDSGLIRPEIKEAIDSYEAFIDEYCEFMKNYNVSDLTMLAKYSELITKEIEMTKQFEDIENQDLNDAESAYFLEVQLRCNQKMTETAVSIGS